MENHGSSFLADNLRQNVSFLVSFPKGDGLPMYSSLPIVGLDNSQFFEDSFSVN